MTLFEKVKQETKTERSFEDFVKEECVLLPCYESLLNGHFNVKDLESICTMKDCSIKEKCKKCWNLNYIEHFANEIKVGTKWWDEEEDITFIITNIDGNNVKYEYDDCIGSMPKEYLLEHCKCIDDTVSESNNVNHPKHYQGKYECIEEMIELFGIDAVISFCKCNVYKYRFRATNKNGQEDIEKAENYMTILFDLEKRKRTGNI